MPSRSKRKGSNFERELVREAQAAGLQAYRCWGSDGRSRGYAKDVDLVLQEDSARPVKLQSKRRARLPAWLNLSKVDGVVLRQDHDEALVVIRWRWFLELMKDRGESGGDDD